MTTLTGDVNGQIDGTTVVRAVQNIPVIAAVSIDGSMLLYDSDYQVWRPQKTLANINNRTFVGERVYWDFENLSDRYIESRTGEDYYRFVIGGTAEAWIKNNPSFSGSTIHFGGFETDDSIRHASGRFRVTAGAIDRMLVRAGGVMIDSTGVNAIDSVDALQVHSTSSKVAVRGYRASTDPDSQVIQARSDVGGTDIAVWYVAADGDTFKVSDPSLKTRMAPAPSYWDEGLDLWNNDAIVRHGWKGDGGVETFLNWNLDVVGRVFPKHVTTPAIDPEEPDAETRTAYKTVNVSAMDRVESQLLLETVSKVQDILDRLEARGI